MWQNDRYQNTNQSNKFFYVTRQSGDVDDIKNMYARLNRDIKTIIHNALYLAYFMRGSMLYNDIIYSMSYVERDMALEFIKQRMEQESKNPHPVY